MYCPKCGTKLAEGTGKCPLCLIDLPKLNGTRKPGFYPATPRPRQRADFKGLLFLVTLFFVIAATVTLALDLVQNGSVSFSFYILAPLFVLYAVFLLPRWWKRPNPVIFLPVAFLCLMGSLLWLWFRIGGNWFFSFALPVLSGFFLFLEAAVTLIWYLRGGKLYIFGGFFLAIGVLSFVGEILYRASFSMKIALTYSILPLVFFSLLGLGLIVIAIVRPFRRYFEQHFFF